MESLKQITESLRNSAMFHLSLSSKELFHSNFLYWLGQSSETSKLFEYVIGCLSGNKIFAIADKTIKRETHNFDLSVWSGSVIEVVIENKVKSLPHAGQLAEYRSKIEKLNGNNDCTLILLSLFPTKMETEGWIQKSYKDLADALIAKTEELVSHSYFKAIINDYTAFILNLDEVSRLSLIADGETYAYKKPPVYPALEKIRLEDFYLKAKYAQIAEMVCSTLGNGVIPKRDVTIKEIMKSSETKGTIYVNHGFSRSDGIIEVKIRAHDFVYLIQIQGDLYRRGFESDKPMPLTDISDGVRSWVNFSDIAPRGIVYPISEDINKYNQYGDTFKYKSIKISETDLKLTQRLAEQIVNDAKTCLEFVNQR